MIRFFTQTKLIILFYAIATLVAFQGVFGWVSLKQLEASMPAHLVELVNEIAQLRQLALSITIMLFALLFVVAFIGWSRQSAIRQLKFEQMQRDHSEALLSAVIDNAPYAVYLKDLAGKYLICNPAFCDIFSLSREACIGKTAKDIDSAEIAAEHEEMEKHCLELDLPVSYEYQHQDSQGAVSNYSIINFPIKDLNGNLLGTGGIDIDITQTKSAVEDLSRQKSIMESILHHLPAGVFLKDLEGRYQHCNRTFCDWHGKAFRELKGRTASEIFSPEKARLFDENDQFCRTNLQVVEHESELVSRDGRTVYEHTIRFPVLDSNGHLIYTGGIDIDISQRKAAEQELKQSHNRLQALADNLPEVITLKDQQGRFLFVNRRFEEWTGFSLDDVYLKTVQDIYAPHQAKSFKELDDYVLQQREIYSHEVELEYPDGGIRTVINTRYPICTESDELVGMGTINHDITERKQAEIALRIAKEQAESADRLKSSFLATMSHELRTPLNSIIGFSGILLQGLAGELNEEQNKQLGMVKNSASHLLSLINDILDISKIEAGSMEVDSGEFELAVAIHNSVNIVKPAADKKSLPLEISLLGNVGYLNSDRRRVEQILLNLLSNAIKFTEQGVIQITCQKSDDSVLISVKDSGVGIKEEDMPRLFQPFLQLEQNTSTRKHEGTGLGLALSRKLAQILGGDIEVQSCWNRGSVFTLSLPLFQPDATIIETESTNN